MSNKNIVIKNLSYIQDSKVLFNNINLTLNQGTIFLVKGANGAGKTTLLKIFAGLIQPSKGNIICNVKKNSIKGLTAYLASDGLLQEEYTVIDYMILWSIIYNGSKNINHKHIEQIMSCLDLYHLSRKQIGTLSLGQKKRLLLSKILLSNRLIWVLDEPTIGLDHYWMDFFYTLLRKHTQNGGIVLLTTHNEHRIHNLKIIHLVSN